MIHHWSLFTKPWKTAKAEELGALAARLGFTGIEFPLRAGYQVDLADPERGLVSLGKTLAQYGVRITSVAGDTSERTFAACHAAGVRILRIMINAEPAIGYRKSMEAKKRELEALAPLCEKYSVTIGVQQHYGFGIFNTMEMRELLEGFNPRHIGAIWDAAHSALSGEIPAQALDIIWDKLVLVNLKMAYYRRANGPEAEQAVFEPYFTTKKGHQNMGLGLYYCWNVMTAHNGSIRVESKPGCGSTFSLCFPVRRNHRRNEGTT